MFNLETISPKMMDYYVNRADALIIDLREKSKYQKSHIRGAINLPYSEDSCILPPRGKIIVLYCDRGNNSLIVGRQLAKRNYEVRSMVGGFEAYNGRNAV